MNSLLSPREQDYLEARELAERIGIKFTGRKREFVVVTALITVGIDLGTVKILPRSEISAQGSGKSIQVIVPPPGIVDLTIEDPNPATYPYPDIPLSPSHWKLVAGLVDRKLRERPLDPSILTAARTQTHKLLTSLFQQAGFTDIELKEESPAETRAGARP